MQITIPWSAVGGAVVGALLVLAQRPAVSNAQIGTAPGGGYTDPVGSHGGYKPLAETDNPLLVPTRDALDALASGAVVAGPGRVSTIDLGGFGIMYSGPLGMTDLRPGVITVINLGTTSVQLSGPEAANAGSWILVLEPGQSRSITMRDGSVNWAALGDGANVELAWALRHP